MSEKLQEKQAEALLLKRTEMMGQINEGTKRMLELAEKLRNAKHSEKDLLVNGIPCKAAYTNDNKVILIFAHEKTKQEFLKC